MDSQRYMLPTIQISFVHLWTRSNLFRPQGDQCCPLLDAQPSILALGRPMLYTDGLTAIHAEHRETSVGHWWTHSHTCRPQGYQCCSLMDSQSYLEVQGDKYCTLMDSQSYVQAPLRPVLYTDGLTAINADHREISVVH